MNCEVSQTSFERGTNTYPISLHFIDYYEFNNKFRFCYDYFSRMKRWLSLYFVILCTYTTCLSQTNKINGVSFVGPPREIDSAEVSLPKRILNSNYLSLMPYGFIPEESTELNYNNEWQWWGEKINGASEMIQLAKKQGYKIMLKPHIWKKHGAFTGHHTYKSTNEWEAFEKSYSTYILDFAALAEKEKVELFCIGTEWGEFVKERPEYWLTLIIEVRKVYKGKLTYAANWDEYKTVPFWKELDYIGVDAYFPLVQDQTPTTSQIKYALLQPLNELRIVSNSNNKPILFTEFGYRSVDYTAHKPWEAGREGTVNLQGQINACEAFFKTFWHQTFIEGGFIWKWFANHQEVGGEKNNGFTPQNKPVEKVIKEWYSF